jgi:plasmid stabilization system protein ParE
MSWSIQLLPEAEAEFDGAAGWYEDEADGLGEDFVDRVQAVFDRITANPRIHQKVFGSVRKAVVRRFPYVVIYQETGSEVLVISVFHTSRDPKEWQRRIL